MTKTVLELDLVGYSSEARRLQQGLNSAAAVAALNRQIQMFVDDALNAVRRPRDGTVMATTGDGAILVFDHPADAHRFAEALHAATALYNDGKVETARRVFRTGAATGDVELTPKPGGGFDMAGTTIADAVRLEAAGAPGHLLVDQDTFAALPADLRRQYKPPEQVKGKRDESYTAYRCVFAGGVPAPAAGGDAGVRPTANVRLSPDRQTAVRLMDKLYPDDKLTTLMVLIDMPADRQPSEALSLAARRAQVLKWSVGPDGCGLVDLIDGLRTLLHEEGGAGSPNPR